MQYGLPDPYELLSNPPTKESWKQTVNKHVNMYRVEEIKEQSALYPSLRFLNVHDYWYGKNRALIQSVQSVREIPRINIGNNNRYSHGIYR